MTLWTSLVWGTRGVPLTPTLWKAHLTYCRNAWSRIDYWLLSKHWHTRVEKTTHMARTYSDHSSVMLSLHIPRAFFKPFAWRFPCSALLDQTFREELRHKIEEYFQHNEGSVDSEGTLWEAFKVVTRGHCIAFHSGLLKDIRNTLATLEKDLQLLERSQAENGSTYI